MASTQSTPIKAIPSTLSSKSLPSIPPAAQIYDPLVRNVLSTRLTRGIFPRTVVWVWVLTGLGVMWNEKGNGSGERLVDVLGKPLGVGAVVVSVVSWVVGALPVVVLCKRYLSRMSSLFSV
jgi:nucleoporin NDC1